MPRFTADSLRLLTAACLQKVDVPGEDATLTARLMVEANLTGHDTHGVRQLPRYVNLIREGTIVAGAPVTMVRETPTTAVLDGHHGLGYVGATRAAELAIEKCRETRLSAVSVRNLNHVGRVGAYPEMIAAAGLVGLVTVNAQAHGTVVMPFGGLAPRMGTNPMGAAFPNAGGPPILLDFATSAVAANKIRQAESRGKPTGESWIVRKDGTPTTDPADFLEGLAMLRPLGGAEGHKGYALAVMVDILSGILAGAGTAVAPGKALNNGTFVICIDPEAFVDRERYQEDLTGLVDYLHATPTAEGDPPVMLPGEFEARNRVHRSKAGIELEPDVWDGLQACAREWEVPLPEPEG